MEHKTRTVDNALLLEEYRTLLETAEQLPLLISGNSMSPFLVHGRDTVYLTKVNRPLRKGDIVLYQRKGGAYILHRRAICFPSSAMPRRRSSAVLQEIRFLLWYALLIEKGSGRRVAASGGTFFP